MASLDGGAADILGIVKVASLYGFVDQILGAWDQRPVFKANVSRLLPLRRCTPIVEPALIRLLPNYFPTPDHVYDLDSSYEPESTTLMTNTRVSLASSRPIVMHACLYQLEEKRRGLLEKATDSDLIALEEEIGQLLN